MSARTIVFACCAALAFGCGGGDDDTPGTKTPDAGSGAHAGSGGATSGSGGMDAGGQIVKVPNVVPPRRSDGGVIGHNDNGFAVSEPLGPRSTARIRGLVLDQVLNPIPSAGASAGGAVVAVAQSGYFLLDEVYGEQEAEVVVRGLAYSEARVRVPIREGEVSHVLVVLASATQHLIADIAAGGAVELPGLDIHGEVDEALPDQLAFTLGANALQTAWGAIGKGRAALRAVVLDSPDDALAIPGQGMFALDADGARVRLFGRAAFELHIAQGGTNFELIAPADVAVPLWPTAEALADPVEDRLYWFDPSEGAFVERGPVAIDPPGPDGSLLAHAEIDRFGFWMIGRPRHDTDCVRGRIIDIDGAGVPHAFVRAVDVTAYDSFVLFADEQGEFCADALAHGTLHLLAIGKSATQGVVRLDETSISVARPFDADVAGMCGGEPGACINTGDHTTTPGPSCVRGTLTGGQWPGEGEWTASDGPRGTITGGEFCIDAPAGITLTFTSSGAMCEKTVAVSSGPGLCGDDTCMDVGAIECCTVFDLCGDNVDNDCDGVADQGCMCGATDCSLTGSEAVGRCCAGEACGGKSRFADKCVPLSQPGFFDPTCPMGVGEDLGGIAGCCLPQGECSLQDYDFGCVPRADLGDVFALAETLPVQTCTPMMP